jgi:predicted metalloprotease with PDZ domain
MIRDRCLVIAVLILGFCSTSAAQSPVTYRISFPAPEHHWMQVEVRFTDVPAGAVRIMMSRTSPGRYAIHDFARDVYDVEIDDGSGAALKPERPSSSEWDVAGRSGTVRVRYRVSGDTTDGTFLGVNSTHAHINIPAALMWARGLEDRAVRVTFELRDGSSWKVATQLHATEEPNTFTAPNLSYLIDSPVEISAFALRTFRVRNATFRLALHHDGTDQEVDRLVQDIARLVGEEAAVYRELPPFEGGAYTFIADLLPSAAWDGMEHRNSTVMTLPGALRVPDQRVGILGTVAHEFFHSWNVERIRPRSLEPFDLEDANTSGELWLAEGFTNYYGYLLLQRAGLWTLDQTAVTWGTTLDQVINSPARKHRTAEEMSRMAPFVDGSLDLDRTDLSNTYLSYYVWGEAIALGLDLTLRERSGGAVTLDDYMRALWVRYGKPGGPAEGLVARPYTMQDARACLAEVSGDQAFADDFFDRFIQGRDVPDYGLLLRKAGLLLRKRNPGRAWIGTPRLGFEAGVARVSSPSIEETPAYAAGIDEGDELLRLDAEPITSAARVEEIVRRHKPGEGIRAQIRRQGRVLDLVITAQEDPHLELVPSESNGALGTSERALRDMWLKSKQ